MIRNLTGHLVRIQATISDDQGNYKKVTQEYQPECPTARFEEYSKWIRKSFEGIDLISKRYGSTVNLPEPTPGVLLIVSQQIRRAFPNRRDLASPGDTIKDEKNRTTVVKNLVINVPGFSN
jgi:hypothetical protein